jgi:L-ascorbate metabolism protein UlaG (beta-lactamase superfamily)
MTRKDSYAQVLESLVAEAVHGALAAAPARSSEPEVSSDGAAEEIDLVLLAHDHVLEQVLECL